MKKIPVSLLILLAFHCNYSFAQTADNKQKAIDIMRNAVKIMDNGQLDSSLVLLRQAAAMDPSNRDIPYEIAYAYYLAEKSDSTVAILTELLKRVQHPQIYEMLGNAYDVLKQTDKALDAYNKGLEIDPKSSRLMLNKAILYAYQDQADNALNWFEKGIGADPQFPSNYFWASQLLAEKEKYVWALLYSEVFILYEPTSKRMNKLSEMMYNIYKNQITFTDSSAHVSLNKLVVMNINDLLDKNSKQKVKLPFEANYEMMVTLATVIPGKKEMSLALISELRSNFIKLYYSRKLNEEYPNALLEFQKKIDDAQLTEPYTYVLLRYGNLEEFNSWVANGGEAKLKSLVTFLGDNYLNLDEKNYLHRDMYQ
ncbi:tetratricopeptide repeat protein [Chitinophaga sp. Hz27]|uniref:tetratricopeptide repeat protein n=1 Tax=Chitinophaga sp. Hz27 TaxID=3347169 RepID=UPI0035DECF44